MMRPILGFLILTLFAGCELFPRRDATANARLYDAVIAELNALEAQGFIDPSNASVVLINRYGTSFGGTVVLEGQNPDGGYLDSVTMADQCIDERSSRNVGRVKRCLRQRFLSDDRLRYSHGGIAYKLPGRAWEVRQSLRSVETTVHFQWYGSLKQFVDIPLIDQRVELVVPDLALQTAMARDLLIENSGATLIDPVYNLVSKPFQTQEQMSNQFVLEIAAAAMQSPGLSNTRANAQAFLRENGYRPSIILLGGFQSLTRFDGIFPTIDLSALPYARRYEVGELITVLSVKQFLQRLGRVSAVREVSL